MYDQNALLKTLESVILEGSAISPSPLPSSRRPPSLPRKPNDSEIALIQPSNQAFKNVMCGHMNIQEDYSNDLVSGEYNFNQSSSTDLRVMNKNSESKQSPDPRSSGK